MNRFISSLPGLNVLISVNNRIIEGQKIATLNQSAETVDISNEILKQWKRVLVGKKFWNVACTGIVLKSIDEFKALKQAFLNGDLIEIKLLESNNVLYYGNGYITSFPLSANYNDTATYNIKITGSGELQQGE